jgi:hypothetical protein
MYLHWLRPSSTQFIFITTNICSEINNNYNVHITYSNAINDKLFCPEGYEEVYELKKCIRRSVEIIIMLV